MYDLGLQNRQWEKIQNNNTMRRKRKSKKKKGKHIKNNNTGKNSERKIKYGKTWSKSNWKVWRLDMWLQFSPLVFPLLCWRLTFFSFCENKRLLYASAQLQTPKFNNNQPQTSLYQFGFVYFLVSTIDARLLCTQCITAVAATSCIQSNDDLSEEKSQLYMFTKWLSAIFGNKQLFFCCVLFRSQYLSSSTPPIIATISSTTAAVTNQ